MMGGGESKLEESKREEPQPSTSMARAMSGSVSKMNFKSSNLDVEWKSWFTRFKIYMKATGLEQENASRKVAILLHVMGEEVMPIFEASDLDLDTVKYEDLVNYLNRYFTPKKNLSIQRHNFFSRKQQASESIEDYVTVLKNLSNSCELGSLRDSIVKDILTCGLTSQYNFVRERFLSEGPIDLDKALELAKGLVLAKNQTDQLGNPSTSIQNEDFVGAVERRSKEFSRSSADSHKQKNNNYSSTKKCYRCGQLVTTSFTLHKCPAIGKRCFKCEGMDHFANCCNRAAVRKGRVQAVENKEDQNHNEDENDFFIGMIDDKEKDDYGNEVSKLARPLPVEYLLIDVPVSTPLVPLFTFPVDTTKTPFPVENRLVDRHIQDFNSFSAYVSQFSPDQFLTMVSDLHLLLYIATMELMPMREGMSPLVKAVKDSDSLEALEWSHSDQWATVEQLVESSRDSGGSTSAGIDRTNNDDSGAGQWTCPHCTYLNPVGLFSCNMCSLPR